jgi:MoaA/NifB/PqqE/SkfB family radical SAM enzyme
VSESSLFPLSGPLRDLHKSWHTLIDPLREGWQKARDYQLQRLLVHPEVLLRHGAYAYEATTKPVVMTSIPSSVEIELTNRCNLACVQCIRSQGLKPYQLGDIKFGHYRKILAQFPHLLSICLNGFGEPLMHPHFLDIVAYTRAVLPWAKIFIYSNGTLLTSELASQLLESGLTEINVSIDAAKPETYRKVRRGGELEVVHENVSQLLSRRRAAGAKLPLVGVNFVMLNDNEGELVPFIEQAANLGVDFVNCISYASYDWGFQNLRSPESYRRELALARKRLDELKLKCRAFPSDDLSWTSPDQAFDCDFFWGQSLRVTFDGNLTLGCCTPFKETYSYGNLLETPFSELWNGPLFRDNRELALRGAAPDPICERCKQQCREFFTPRDPALVSLRRRPTREPRT